MFDFSVITGNAHLLWQGLLITLYYTVITIGAGLVLGLTIGLVQLSTIRPLVWLGWMFVEFFRNIPLLVILLWTYYALPIFLGINITKGWAGFLALSCYTAAFYAEILRAGVQSIDLRPDRRGHRARHVLRPAHAPHHPASGAPAHDPAAGRSIHHPDEEHHLAVRHHRAGSALSGQLYIELHLSPDGSLHGDRGIFLILLVPLTMLSRMLERRGVGVK